MSVGGYAVVDVETTGLYPGRHDRIAEVAVVQLDRDGALLDEWCTLVNPERDLGPQHCHGIRGCDARQAPTFAEIAGELAARLAGQVIVGHNIGFDLRFLVAEYLRMGVEVPIDRNLGLCTMNLSSRYLNSPSRSLTACCTAAGITHVNAHSALHDARACAQLLTRFIRQTQRPEPWFEVWTAAQLLTWPPLSRSRARLLRGSVAAAPVSFLARLVDRLPRVAEPRADEYLALLDRALLDRHLSDSEQDALLELAQELGLSVADTVDLNRAYLTALAAAALADAVVTDDERKDLLSVAELLGLSRYEVDIALEAPKAGDATPRLSRFRLNPGDLIAFTGQMNGVREEWEARAIKAGLRVGNVTRKTRLLVAADPDSLSGKAATARRYGIPIVTAEAFAKLIVQVR